MEEVVEDIANWFLLTLHVDRLIELQKDREVRAFLDRSDIGGNYS